MNKISTSLAKSEKISKQQKITLTTLGVITP